MNKKMTRIISLMLVICETFSLISFAASNEEEMLNEIDVNGFNQLIIEQMNSDNAIELSISEQAHINKYKGVLNVARENELLSWNGEEIVVSDEIYSFFDRQTCEQFILDMQLYTQLININLIKISDDFTFESNAEEYIMQSEKETLSEDMVRKFFNKDNSISLLSDDCGLPFLGLGALVSQNYRELMDVYISLGYTEGSNAYSATVGYWIGKVSPGGPWDYKTKPGYSPYSKTFCCTYGVNSSKQNYHRTSEFIGNYNYGYTGRILFSLDVLKFGSSAVAGFDPKDSEDHPAITEGYNDCGLIE